MCEMVVKYEDILFKRRGRGTVLELQKYEYYKQIEYRSGDTIWRCSKYKTNKCIGSITISLADKKIKKIKQHSGDCFPDFNELIIKNVIADCIAEAVQGEDTIPAIYKKTVVSLKDEVEECKENWNKLRNCYNNAMKRRQRKSGQAGKKFAPWRFEEQMSFLKPYLESLPTTGNLDDLDATVSNENSSLPSPESQIFTESNLSCTRTPKSKTSYKRKANPSSDEYLAGMMKSSQENRFRKEEMDDIDTFFLSMSKTTKKLPKIDQIQIKMDLLKAISKAELKQLEAQENTLRTPIPIRSRISRESADVKPFDRFTPHASYVEVPQTQVSSDEEKIHYYENDD